MEIIYKSTENCHNTVNFGNLSLESAIPDIAKHYLEFLKNSNGIHTNDGIIGLNAPSNTSSSSPSSNNNLNNITTNNSSPQTSDETTNDFEKVLSVKKPEYEKYVKKNRLLKSHEYPCNEYDFKPPKGDAYETESQGSNISSECSGSQHIKNKELSAHINETIIKLLENDGKHETLNVTPTKPPNKTINAVLDLNPTENLQTSLETQKDVQRNNLLEQYQIFYKTILTSMKNNNNPPNFNNVLPTPHFSVPHASFTPKNKIDSNDTDSSGSPRKIVKAQQNECKLDNKRSDQTQANGFNENLGVKHEHSDISDKSSLIKNSAGKSRKKHATKSLSKISNNNTEAENDLNNCCNNSSNNNISTSSTRDELYWERRRKNNESAKRSRDARRTKEEEVALKASLLEQENTMLKAQLAVLKNETAKLHYLLFRQYNIV